jgi:hypothetical protein
MQPAPHVPHSQGTRRKRLHDDSSLVGVLSVSTVTKPRPPKYRCRFCCYIGDSGNMVRHERVHTGDKPYACSHPGCSYASARSDDVTKHERRHSNDRCFACTQCPFTSTDGSNLRRHERRRHQQPRPSSDVVAAARPPAGACVHPRVTVSESSSDAAAHATAAHVATAAVSAAPVTELRSAGEGRDHHTTSFREAPRRATPRLELAPPGTAANSWPLQLVSNSAEVPPAVIRDVSPTWHWQAWYSNADVYHALSTEAQAQWSLTPGARIPEDTVSFYSTM